MSSYIDIQKPQGKAGGIPWGTWKAGHKTSKLMWPVLQASLLGFQTMLLSATYDEYGGNRCQSRDWNNIWYHRRKWGIPLWDWPVCTALTVASSLPAYELPVLNPPLHTKLNGKSGNLKLQCLPQRPVLQMCQFSAKSGVYRQMDVTDKYCKLTL